MTKLPSLTGKKIISTLRKAGFDVVRVKGSHPDGRTTVVPVHSGETIGPGLMFKILRDCEITRSDFQSLL